MNKGTKIYVSIASQPGEFGRNFHNGGYKELNVNAIYIPLKVLPEELQTILNLVKNNFAGCSVSMPHKTSCIPFLDRLDKFAQEIGAVNTILNEDGVLIGYNTDYYGAERLLNEAFPNGLEGRKILMMGAGGVAKAVGLAVKNKKGILTIVNRTEENSKGLASKLDASTIPWESIKYFSGYLLINATNVGMSNEDEMPINPELLLNYPFVMDVVAKKTRLLSNALQLGKTILRGENMAVYQAAKQFQLYTGKELPENFINKFLKK